MVECQWTHWSEVGDCSEHATQEIKMFGEIVHVCQHHANVLRSRFASMGETDDVR